MDVAWDVFLAQSEIYSLALPVCPEALQYPTHCPQRIHAFQNHSQVLLGKCLCHWNFSLACCYWLRVLTVEYRF